VQATLASYIASTGCTVESFFFSNFSFQVGSVSGGAVPIGSSDIMVTPLTAVLNSPGLAFNSGGFSVTGAGAVSYIIGYTEDPEGDIRSMDDVLDDPVAPPGVGQIVSQGCLGFAFSPNCSGPTVSISVFDDGIAPRLTDSVTFAGVNTFGEQHTLSLDGHGTGSVKINGFSSSSSMVPEPSTAWLAVPGAAALVFLRKMRLKLAQVRFERRT